MRLLRPDVDGELDATTLETIYAYPSNLDRPWVRTNFVASLDGATSLHGHSAGLSGPADQRILNLQRDLADVVLVGANTALVERYSGIRPSVDQAARRARYGLSSAPPVAVVTRTCSLVPDSPLLADTVASPIVITCEAAPASSRQDLTNAGADVLIAGGGEVDLELALAELDRRGLRRGICEGGPRLFGSLMSGDLVDQFCLTLSPLLVGSNSDRISRGAAALNVPRRFNLGPVMRAGEFLFLSYERQR